MRVNDDAELSRKLIISLGVIILNLNMEVMKPDNGTMESMMEVLLIEHNASAINKGSESG